MSRAPLATNPLQIPMISDFGLKRVPPHAPDFARAGEPRLDNALAPIPSLCYRHFDAVAKEVFVHIGQCAPAGDYGGAPNVVVEAMQKLERKYFVHSRQSAGFVRGIVDCREDQEGIRGVRPDFLRELREAL